MIIGDWGKMTPKGIFGTTQGLSKKFGQKIILETPTSENAEDRSTQLVHHMNGS